MVNRRLAIATLVVVWLVWAGAGPALPDARPPRCEVVFAPSGRDHRVHAVVGREIGAARHTVDVAMFAFTSKELAELLGQARRRGCAVRVLLDHDSTAELETSQHALLRRLELPVRRVRPGPREGEGRGSDRGREGDGPRRDAKFHHKFCVVDARTVLTGSFNWTLGADEINYENLVVVENAALARAFVAEFDRIWTQRELAVNLR